MADKPTKKRSPDINDWARALYFFNNHLAGQLDEDKRVGIAAVKELGLPRYENIEAELIAFLENPNQYFVAVGSRRFYINLIPKQGIGRFGEYNLSRDDVIFHIRSKIAAEDYGRYVIVVQQYFENIYGGSIVVGQEINEVEGEFRRKTMSGIASGFITPEIIVKRNEYGEFSFRGLNDEVSRRQILRAIYAIPHSSQGRSAWFEPGYYELAIVKDDFGVVRPIFTDCRTNYFYQPKWKKQR
jgi:hypothetical protein